MVFCHLQIIMCFSAQINMFQLALQFVSLAWLAISQNSLPYMLLDEPQPVFSRRNKGEKWSSHFVFACRTSGQRILLLTKFHAYLLIFLKQLLYLQSNRLFPQSFFGFSTAGPCVCLATWQKALISPIKYTLYVDEGSKNLHSVLMGSFLVRMFQLLLDLTNYATISIPDCRHSEPTVSVLCGL